MRYLFLLFLVMTGPALRAQDLTPAQKAELEQAAQLLKQYQDPVFMSKLLDEQIQEARKNGATPAQIRELEQAKAETIRQLKADLAEADRQKNQPASVPEKDDPDPNETMLAAYKKRITQPDTLPASLIYDEVSGRYSDLPASFRFYAESKLPANEFPAFMLKKYGVTLRETGRYNFDGPLTIRYEQLHAGYLVGLAQFSVTLDKDGHVVRANGDLFEIKTPAPRLNTETLAATLLPQLRTATKQPALPLVPASDDDPSATTYAQPEPLVWMFPRLNPDKATAVLTQPFIVEVSGSSRRWYLNATTGAVVATETLTRNCHVPPEGPRPIPATVPTFHLGKRPVFLSRKTGPKGVPVFALADSSETPTIIILQPGIKPRAPIFTKDSTFADNELRLRGDFDALYGFRTVARYVKKMGLNSYNNAGVTVKIEPYQEENADWNPTRKRFRYGIGNKKPYSTLQIIGHEFTHAINTYANKLVYQGESGAIDESVADMFGTIIDHQTLNGNWLLGEEITPGGFRNIANPTAKGHPDTYEAGLWKPTSTTYDEGNVHSNSGVGNRWFYLLIKGGKGQNALKNNYDVKTPVSYDLVARMLLQTLPRLTPRATYEDFCRETIATAEQLFGDCHDFTQSVKQAWYAVGVLTDPPPLCKPGWTMEVVMKSGSEKTRSMLYIKGDSLVSVYKDPENTIKTFSRRSSAYMTWVVLNADGLTAATLPKDFMNNYYQKVDELIPVQEAMMAEQLRQVRATMNNPAANAEDRAHAKEAEAMLIGGQQEMEKAKVQFKADQAELAQPVKAQSEAAFWRNQGGKRKFDKAYVKGTTTYEGRYMTRKYVLSAAMSWWSTPEIPLRLSDVVQLLPTASVAIMRSSLDYLMRGFPVQYMDMMRMQNISESVPNNFDRLFSDAGVFE